MIFCQFDILIYNNFIDEEYFSVKNLYVIPFYYVTIIDYFNIFKNSKIKN